MHSFGRLAIAVSAAVATTAATPLEAGASEPFGQHVAMCAHELGKRADAPAVTCTHDGMTMTFANFGEMVDHIRAMH